jgi:spore coat protein U-like protein
MFRNAIVVGGALGVLCGASTIASAVTDKTSNMAVSMTVTSECTLTANPLVFDAVGATTLSTTASNAASTLNIQCTDGTTYSITMDAGSGDGATAATRKMTSGANTLDYSVYSDASHTDLIGGTGDELTGTADGSAQAINIYGMAPAQAAPVGDYTDTITVTLSY